MPYSAKMPWFHISHEDSVIRVLQASKSKGLHAWINPVLWALSHLIDTYSGNLSGIRERQIHVTGGEGYKYNLNELIMHLKKLDTSLQMNKNVIKCF